MIFGVAPAWSASRADPAAALRGVGRSTRNPATRTQRLLVSAQVALSLVLLAGAGLMLRTLGNLENQNFGFRPEGRVVINVHASLSGYAPEKLSALYREVERRMGTVAGVRSAALSLYAPMEGNNWNRASRSKTSLPIRHILFSLWDRVSALLRDHRRPHPARPHVRRARHANTHVVVVNRPRRHVLRQSGCSAGASVLRPAHCADMQIVGIVENVIFRNPRNTTPPPMFFVPLLQMWKSEWPTPRWRAPT